MSERPNRIYRSIKSQAYSRDEYIKTKPQLGLFYSRGDLEQKYQGYRYALENYDGKIFLSSNCLGAAARNLFRKMSLIMKLPEFRIDLAIHPHERQRENRGPTGAGADRTSMGMRKAFGKVRRLAARMKSNIQEIFRIVCRKPISDENLKELQKILSNLLPGKQRIILVSTPKVMDKTP